MLGRIAVVLVLLGAVSLGPAAAESGPRKGPDLDYARVCATMGEGFTNIAGTETCVRISGFVKTGTSFGHTDIAPPAAPLPRIHLPK